MNPFQIIYGVVALAIVTAVGGYIALCESAKSTLEQSVVIAEAAQKKAEDQIKNDRNEKENADADHKVALDRLTRDLKRLRDANARSSLVPPSPAGSSRTDLACFDRADFAGALRDFETAVEGLVGEGTEATIGLNIARRWASNSAPPPHQ